MSWLTLENIAGQLWARMADASLRAIMLAMLAGVLVACLRKRAAAQHLVWTVVVAGMVLLPVLRPMIPAAPLPIAQPQLLQAVSVKPRPQSAATAVSTLSAPARGANEAASLRPSWHLYAAIIYTAGVLLLAIRLFLGLLLSRSLLRRARPLREELWRYHNLIADARVEVEIQESERVRVPVTHGLKTMRVILPKGWRAWPEQKMTVVLTHELTHARRRDPLLALMAAVNKCIFWFHPLAWWLERQLAVLAEQAADDAAVAVARDAESYARMVLEVAARMKEQNGRLVWHGTALDGSLVAQRIRRVMDPRTQKYVKRLGKTARVSLLTSAGLLLWIVAAVDFHSTTQAQDTVSSLVSPQPVRVSEQVAARNLIEAPLPVYPPLAKKAHIQDTVILLAVVDIHGHVTDLKVIAGHPMLVQAAMEAVRSYLYKPFLLNGNPVRFQTTVQVPFGRGAKIGPEIETQLEAARQRGSIPPPPPPPPPPPKVVALTPASSSQMIRVSKRAAAGNLIESVKPVYPPVAKAAHVQGIVKLNVRIGSDGRVTDVNLISGHPMLVQAAIEAVKEYVYKPYLLNANPVEIATIVEVQFKADPN